MKNSFFRKYKNEFALYRIRKKLTIIAVLLVVFAMLTMLLFYLSERSSYQKNMAESNEIMASQMASVYELYMQNVKENGGIMRDEDITDTDFKMPELIEVRLQDARNQLKNNTFYIVQSYGVPLRKLTDEDF